MSISSSANNAATNLENAVAAGKEAVAKAEVAAQTYQIRQDHWDKLSQAEGRFQNFLQRIDNLYRGNSEKIAAGEMQIKILFWAGVIFMIGSTAALWYFTK